MQLSMKMDYKRIFIKREDTTPLNRIIDVLSSYGGKYRYNSRDASASYFRIENTGYIKSYADIGNSKVIEWLIDGYEMMVYSASDDKFTTVDTFEVVRMDDKNGLDKFEIWPAGHTKGSADDILMYGELSDCLKFKNELDRKHEPVPVDETTDHDKLLRKMARVFAFERNPDKIYKMLKNIGI